MRQAVAGTGLRLGGAIPRVRSLARACALATLALAAAGGANAAHALEADVDLTSLSLEQLLDVEVATASRFDQKVGHAPAAVQVIGADEIRAHGWRTLGEALSSLPGLFLSDNGLYTYLGSRGLLRAGDYDTRFLLLVDGHRINDPVYSQAPVGHDFPLDMALVERIEYVPGPGSAVYGSNAFFGVINVRTRAPDAATGGVAVSAGSHGMRGTRASAVASGPLGDTVLSASDLHRDGRDVYAAEFADDPSGGVARGMDAERSRKLMLRHTAGGLGLLLLAAERTKEDPVAPYAQAFGLPGAGIGDRWILLGAQYEHALDADTRWQVQADVMDYRYVGDYVYAEDGVVTVNRDIARGQSLVLETRVVTTAFPRHTVVAGFEARLDNGVEQRNFDLEPRESYLSSRHDVASFGAFVNDEFLLGGDWRLDGGLRLDRDDTGTVRASPRLALVSSPEGGTTFKAIVGEAFRSPNAYERFYNVEDASGSQLSNPDLAAERIRTAELFLGRNVGARTRVEASLFDYRLRDLITLVGNGDLLTLENSAEASSTGAELSIRHHWSGGAVVRASHAWSRVRDSRDGEALNAPRNVAKLLARIPLRPGLAIAADMLHVGRRATKGGHVGAYTVVGANLLWDDGHQPLSVSAGVRNLFDRYSADPVGPEFAQDAVPRIGRETRVEVTWRF
jgi:outer membrane receptor protein involved in Fe transport